MAVVAPLASRLSGRTLMRLAVVALVAARLASYSTVAFGMGLPPLILSIFLGAVAGTTMVNAAKVYVPDDGAPSRSFAWMAAASSLGAAAGTTAAGLLAVWGSPALLVALGLPAGVVSLVPMLRLAARATDRPQARPDGEGLGDALRRGGPTVALTTLIAVAVGGMAAMRDGLVADLYSGSWLGPVAVAALAGDLLATQMVSRLQHRKNPAGDLTLWPLLAAAGTIGWALADTGIGWLLAAQLVGSLCGSTRVALTEGRLLQQVGRQHLVAVASTRDALAALAAAFTAALLPGLLDDMGFQAATLLSVAPLLLIATLGLVLHRWPPLAWNREELEMARRRHPAGQPTRVSRVPARRP